MESQYAIDDKLCSSFKCNISLEASYEKEHDFYYFRLDRRKVLLNNRKPEKLMDRIVYEIGNSLYPLKLKVSPYLQIVNVDNLKEIYSRWKACTEKSLQKNDTEQLRKYIRIAGANFFGKEQFIESLYRDTFVKLYFRDIYKQTAENERKLIRWDNFPEGKMNSSYLYRVEQTDSMIRTTGEVMKILPDMEGTYQMEYKIGMKGEIGEINGSVDKLHNNKKYSKQITITAENVKAFDMNYKSLILDE